MPSPVSTVPLVVAKAWTWASVKLCPPITRLAMPSVAETVKLPVAVSLLEAASEPLGLSPASWTVLSGPVAAAVTTEALSLAPVMVMVSVAGETSPSASCIV